MKRTISLGILLMILIYALIGSQFSHQNLIIDGVIKFRPEEQISFARQFLTEAGFDEIEGKQSKYRWSKKTWYSSESIAISVTDNDLSGESLIGDVYIQNGARRLIFWLPYRLLSPTDEFTAAQKAAFQVMK